MTSQLMFTARAGLIAAGAILSGCTSQGSRSTNHNVTPRDDPKVGPAHGSVIVKHATYFPHRD